MRAQGPAEDYGPTFVLASGVGPLTYQAGPRPLSPGRRVLLQQLQQEVSAAAIALRTVEQQRARLCAVREKTAKPVRMVWQAQSSWSEAASAPERVECATAFSSQVEDKERGVRAGARELAVRAALEQQREAAAMVAADGGPPSAASG